MKTVKKAIFAGSTVYLQNDVNVKFFRVLLLMEHL